jgi:two-component system sensor histidine kinase QseC
LRNRFVFIILAALILAAVGINLVHVHFFESQRRKLIDRQISEASQTLLESKEFLDSVSTPEGVEDAISRVLQGTRIGKVFLLRDPAGKIMYQSFNAGLLKAELPTKPEWVAAETETEYVRLRNIKLPKSNLVLQVGLVLDWNFLNWEILDNRVINYVSGIVLALFAFSVLLTFVLLAPLRLLIGHLKEATSNLSNLMDVRPLPVPLSRYTQGFWSKSDEFSSLLTTVQKLIDRINLNYKLTRSWTFQMAHELKTPLSIIRAETTARRRSGELPAKYAEDVVHEVGQMSDIINQFLEWAELENSQGQKDLHVIRASAAVKSVALRLEKISPGRINLHFNSDFSIFANPAHLDQMISNLLTNALKFSGDGQAVDIVLSKRTLVVRDRGPGIPDEVRERLGEPFNVGSPQSGGPSGHGLGLAWVLAVTKLYGWNFTLRGGAGGTEAEVSFPSEET